MNCIIMFNSPPASIYRTLSATLDARAQSLATTLNERSTQITSDGIKIGLNEDFLNGLGQQLTDISGLMDPRTIKQKNDDVIGSLNEENCKMIILIDGQNSKFQQTGDDGAKWPGENQGASN